MKRRHFMGTAISAGMSGVVPASASRLTEGWAAECGQNQLVSDALGGMSLKALREDYRHRLFEQYLPFWEKGGHDSERGGFMCELNDDGSVAADEKHIWYQGLALWVYAFLYSHFGKASHWLDIAAKTKDFMVKHMYAGDGRWVEKVHRDGTPSEGVGKMVYGWLFAAGGLAQCSMATGDSKSLELAKESISAAVKAYDDPTYADTFTVQYTAVEVPNHGVRTQGHSMVLIWAIRSC